MAKTTERSPLLNQPQVQLTPTWVEEGNWLFRKSVPVSTFFTIRLLANTAGVLALGHLGSTELAASALAVMYLMITTFTFTYGCSSALDTLVSQAWTGAQDRTLVGVHLQRAFVILSLMHVPVALLCLNANRIFLSIGQEPEVALYAAIYLRYYLIGAPAYAFFDATRKYLQAIGVMSAATYAVMIASPIGIALTYVLVFCEPFNLGFDGVPIAGSITSWLMFFVIAVFARFSPGYYEGWGGWNRACLKDWGLFFRFAIPGIINSFVEVGSYDLISFGASYLGRDELAAQSILMVIRDITNTMGWGVSSAAATRIGHALGSGRPADAQQAVRCSYGLILGLGSIASAVLLVWSERLAYLFTPDTSIVLAVVTMLPKFAVGQIFLGLGNVSTGILRGVGRPDVSAWINTVMYYAIGLPVAYILTFKADWQLDGLMTGLCLGIFLVSGAHVLYISAIDWLTVTQKTQERIQQEERKVNDAFP
ncbi:mate-domain-containing protein [Fennellomyces sp. T-0311]|nr:mate-domain-containing protein [Fennellomyces sp. T-0311]